MATNSMEKKLHFNGGVFLIRSLIGMFILPKILKLSLLLYLTLFFYYFHHPLNFKTPPNYKLKTKKYHH